MSSARAHQPAPEPFFLDRHDGSRRFCVLHRPAHAAWTGCMLYLHPFAEEMNKTRRMAALQSRALAARGIAVLQLDLLGCGDSSGDFGDAGWEDWVADALAACDWLRSHSTAPLWLWGLRAGTLLAQATYARLTSPANLLYWQPTPSGRLLLQQFLRLHKAASLADSSREPAVEAPRARLARGEAVEVAGYRLSPALAQGIEAATLQPGIAPLSMPGTRLVWVEQGDSAEPSPASAATLRAWAEAGVAPELHRVAAPPFWQTVEVEIAPAFLEATSLAVPNARAVP